MPHGYLLWFGLLLMVTAKKDTWKMETRSLSTKLSQPKLDRGRRHLLLRESQLHSAFYAGVHDLLVNYFRATYFGY